MGVMLQPKICMCEGYQDMRPRCSEAFAFTHIGDSFEVFFVLPLRLVHWFIGSSRDGINDVDHTAGGHVACSFGYLAWFKLWRWR
jgi:hypothetical protein